MCKAKVSRIVISFTIIALLFTCLAGCGQKQAGEEQLANTSAGRTIVDMAGRSHTVPAEVDKIFSTSPVGTIMTYSLAPDKLIGWNYVLREGEKKFVLKEYQDLPDLGGWYAKATCNTEELLKINPDVIISMGFITDTSVSQADKIQEQIGIPVIMVDGELANLDKAYEFMGDLFDEEEKAKELGEYCRDTVAELQEKVKGISEDKKVRVYYAEGAAGLQTDPQGSMHTEVLDMAGGINVAEVVQKGGMGMAAVSLEQVILWNPELILSWGTEQGGYFESIFTDPKWESIQAVKDKRVYAVPAGPFNWFDRPPSINRVLGLKWVANLLYPDVFTYDIRQETKDFYSKFYHYELSDKEVDGLLQYSIPQSQ